MKEKENKLDVEKPKEKCSDKKCPFHGQIKIKNETFTGKVVKKDVNRSATIEWERQRLIKKYERHERRRSRLRVHNPACLNASIGDEVLAARTRPLSKSKNFVIIKIIKKLGEK
ncbi:30S ribosomal protein S17 [Nanoarchaeota archaeon]